MISSTGRPTPNRNTVDILSSTNDVADTRTATMHASTNLQLASIQPAITIGPIRRKRGGVSVAPHKRRVLYISDFVSASASGRDVRGLINTRLRRRADVMTTYVFKKKNVDFLLYVFFLCVRT